jgi:hypothetical protein
MIRDLNLMLNGKREETAIKVRVASDSSRFPGEVQKEIRSVPEAGSALGEIRPAVTMHRLTKNPRNKAMAEKPSPRLEFNKKNANN